MRKADNGLVGPYRTVNTAVPAGGFVINFDQHPSGWPMLHSGDVVGPLVRDSDDNEWRWLLNSKNLTEAQAAPAFPFDNGDNGSAGARVAPSNANIIASMRGGWVYKSTDRGNTQAKTNLGPIYALSNSGQQRLTLQLLDIHPTNENIWLIGSNDYPADRTKSGAFYTLDGGATPAVKITGLPNPGTRHGYPDTTRVVIDPGDPTKGYAHVGGSGVYPLTISGSGVAAGALISGSPTNCNQIIVTAAGDLFIARGGAQNGSPTNDIYRRTRAGVATSYTSGAQSGAIGIAVDPTTPARWVAVDEDGAFFVTFNTGGAWTRYVYFDGNFSRGDGEVAWIGNKTGAAGSIFPCTIRFDTQVANKLWVCHGLGLGWIAIPTASGGALVLHDYSNGNAEKVSRCGLSIPGKGLIVGNYDYNWWKLNSLTKPINTGIIGPTPYGNVGGLPIGCDLDYAQDNTSFVVGAVANSNAANVVSLNAGDSWGNLAGQTASWGQGGAVAVNRQNQIVLLECNNGKGRITDDGGANWSTIKLDGSTDTIGFINSSGTRRLSVSADKERSGYFALVYTVVNDGGATGTTHGGLWIRPGAGQPWQRTIIGVIGSGLPGYSNSDHRQFWQCELRYVPGFAGELVYTPHCDYAAFQNDRLYWISNDGTRTGGPAVVQTLGANVRSVRSFSFGKIAPGQTRPSVHFYGQVNGVWGSYVSYDWFATDPVLIDDKPIENFTGVNVVLANKDKLGQALVGAIGWRHHTRGPVLTAKAP